MERKMWNSLNSWNQLSASHWWWIPICDSLMHASLSPTSRLCCTLQVHCECYPHFPDQPSCKRLPPSLSMSPSVLLWFRQHPVMCSWEHKNKPMCSIEVANLLTLWLSNSYKGLCCVAQVSQSVPNVCSSAVTKEMKYKTCHILNFVAHNVCFTKMWTMIMIHTHSSCKICFVVLKPVMILDLHQ